MVATPNSTTYRPIEISVVMPAYRSAGQIALALESLAAQTLDPARFEVVVVLNGPDDGALTRIRELRERFPGLQVRIVHSPTPGAGRARNLGLAAAAGRYVTFLDHDDRLSRNCLGALLKLAAPGVVPIAHVADVQGDGRGTPQFDNYIARRTIAFAGEVHEVGSHSAMLGFVSAKLVPTDLARQVRFDEQLSSGEDLLYWYELFALAPFRLAPAPIADHAVYYRSVREGSVSRQAESYEFAVIARLDVMEKLCAVEPEEPKVRRLQQAMLRAQAGFAARYLTAHPDDHAKALVEVRDRGLEDQVPWRAFNVGVARDLAILYAFVPYADTSAGVAARRIRARGVVVDVVSNQLDAIRGMDRSMSSIAAPYVARERRVPARATALGWNGLDDFCRLGLETVEGWVEIQGPYRTVYSRVMLPGSHLLAALVKERWPETRWIAEFSDPIVMNPYGQARAGQALDDDLWRQLQAILSEAGVEAPADRNIPRLVELLAYALADEIVFTNPHQMEFMLEYLPEQQLVPSIRERARVAHHPTLPREFYERETTDFEPDPDRVNIGYFGVFYATRGLTEVVEAVRQLTDAERDRLVLHIFTSEPRALANELKQFPELGDVIVPRSYLPYLQFLNLTTMMDVLLVNDAETTQHYQRNPYLPSKVSDYLGSGTDIWSVVEEGSVLSGMPMAYQSVRGDSESALAVLRRILEEKARRGDFRATS